MSPGHLRLLFAKYRRDLVVEAARMPAEQLSRRLDVNDRPAPTLAHIAWMCEQAPDFLDDFVCDCGQHHKADPKKIEKAQRWLGFIQGVLWSSGFYSIDELRNHSTSSQSLLDELKELMLRELEGEPPATPPATPPAAKSETRDIQALLVELDTATAVAHMEIDTTLVISTCNATREEIEILERCDHLSANEEEEWLEFNVESEDHPINMILGPNLTAIVQYARSLGVTHLRLDRDAEALPGFPEFDW